MINQLNTECVLTDKSPIKLAFPETDFEFTKRFAKHSVTSNWAYSLD